MHFYCWLTPQDRERTPFFYALRPSTEGKNIARGKKEEDLMTSPFSCPPDKREKKEKKKRHQKGGGGSDG